MAVEIKRMIWGKVSSFEAAAKLFVVVKNISQPLAAMPQSAGSPQP